MSPIKKKVNQAVQQIKVGAKRGRKPKAQTIAASNIAAAKAAAGDLGVDAVKTADQGSAGVAVSQAPAAVAPPAISVKPRSAHGKKYFYAVGRRKSAIAQVRVLNGKGDIKVNNIELVKYFPTVELQAAALAPLSLTNQASQVDVNIKVYGGGKRAQADSVRHGLSRALVLMNVEFKPTLKKMGLLTRDSRVKERKKYGLKGARRAPQWQKR